MSQQIRHIAERIVELRTIAGKSPEEMATELGVPLASYQGYESGSVDIPVGFLMGLAARFKIEPAVLMTGDNPRLHVFSVVRKGKGAGVERRREYRYEALAPNFIHKKAEPLLVTVDPGGESDAIAFNVHPGQEFNYLLEGILRVVVDDHEIILHPGDALFFDSSHRHGMQAVGGNPARFLAVVM